MNARVDLALIQRIAADLAAYADDEAAYLDTLDGETDVLAALDALIEGEQADRAMADGIKARADALRDRASRFDARADAARRGMQAIMAAAALRKVVRPLATLSVQPGRVSVQITDPDEVPTQLRKPGAPDKTAIRAQIEAGGTVPGAVLLAGDETLTMRIK